MTGDRSQGVSFNTAAIAWTNRPALLLFFLSLLEEALPALSLVRRLCSIDGFCSIDGLSTACALSTATACALSTACRRLVVVSRSLVKELWLLVSAVAVVAVSAVAVD